MAPALSPVVKAAAGLCSPAHRGTSTTPGLSSLQLTAVATSDEDGPEVLGFATVYR